MVKRKMIKFYHRGFELTFFFNHNPAFSFHIIAFNRSILNINKVWCSISAYKKWRKRRRQKCVDLQQERASGWFRSGTGLHATHSSVQCVHAHISHFIACRNAFRSQALPISQRRLVKSKDWSRCRIIDFDMIEIIILQIVFIHSVH